MITFILNIFNSLIFNILTCCKVTYYFMMGGWCTWYHARFACERQGDRYPYHPFFLKLNINKLNKFNVKITNYLKMWLILIKCNNIITATLIFIY